MASNTLQPEGCQGHLNLSAVQTVSQKALGEDLHSSIITSTKVLVTQQSEASSMPLQAAAGDAVGCADALFSSAFQGDAHPAHPSDQDALLQSLLPQHGPQTPPPKKSLTEGMRREWRFAFQFVHQAGQLSIQCSPKWEYRFIEVDQTAVGLAQNDRSPIKLDSTPMLAVLSYTDRTAVIQSPRRPPGGTGSSPSAGVPSRWPGGSRSSLATSPVESRGNTRRHTERTSFAGSLSARDSVGVASTTAGDRIDGDAWWVEKSKTVDLFYCHPAPEMNLKQFCKRCVQYILRDARVTSVDGDTRLTRLRIGDKLRCPHRLGGHHRSFELRYTLHDRSELQETYAYVIGCIAGKRGYMLCARCTEAEELEGYVQTVLLPAYVTPGRAQFGVDVTYRYVPPTELLGVQQEAFGELQYIDHNAAIIFVTPLYPMRVLLDYSPAKTVGVGSITCVTLELRVHERLLDDTLAAEITGVSKYKVVTIIMCIEVEEVSRMEYPTVMSTEKYSELKAARVAEVFPDAKIIGLPTNRLMGHRTGRMRTMTFTHEPFGCVVKALITSTLVGNFGVTALYLTKPSGGAFDAHLYVFQQLLSGMVYLPQNYFAMNERVSRSRARNIRLVKEDIIHAYKVDTCFSSATAPTTRRVTQDSTSPLSNLAGERPYSAMFAVTDERVVAATRERHLHFLSLCNDGRVEGSVEALVSPEEGGIMTTRRSMSITNPNANGLRLHSGYRGAADADGTSAIDTGTTRSQPVMSSTFAASTTSDALMVATPLPSALIPGDKAVGSMSDEVLDASGADLSSLARSSSDITVSNISHLFESTSASLEDDPSNSEDTMCVAVEEGHDTVVCNREGTPGPVTQLDDSGVTSAFVVSTAVSMSPNRPPAPLASDTSDYVGERSATDRRNSSSSSSNGSATPIAGRVAGTTGGAEDAEAPVTPLGGDASAASALNLHDFVDRSGDTNTVPHSSDTAPGMMVTPPSMDDKDDTSVAARLEQKRLYEELVGKGDPAVQQALREAEGGTLYGPSLRDVYTRCCEAQQCRPNSYLMQKLPVQPEFTYSVEEIDLSANYVGHNGFVAVLHLLEHLPRLRAVYFSNMSLDNMDAESLCYVLATNLSVCEVHLEHNPGISLPAVRHFTALLRVNKRIEVLALAGTRLSPMLIAKLQDEASHPRV
ncbi:hypothetical protein JKF63_06395 [Porcisia hertigi]|uniref:Uncharacterized protein n=1 Tax=Porcisia hertigi TaxID=2761500 RepID=A0A836LJV3_9TRYP|nr:hypothetical protein JKF63_06395 [Porcisia hertigi]